MQIIWRLLFKVTQRNIIQFENLYITNKHRAYKFKFYISSPDLKLRQSHIWLKKGGVTEKKQSYGNITERDTDDITLVSIKFEDMQIKNKLKSSLQSKDDNQQQNQNQFPD